MVTAIEVLDTSVKVGLGALITGFATYWVAKLNHSRTADKERAQRQRVLLEKVAEQIVTVNQATRMHWTFVYDWVVLRPEEAQMSETELTEFRRLRNEVIGSYKELAAAQASLLLLGETKCELLLREYAKKRKLYWEHEVAARTMTRDRLVEDKKEFGKQREALFTELSRIYKNIL